MKRRPAPDRVAYGSLRELHAATGLSQSYWRAAIESGALPARRSGLDSDGNPAGNYVVLARDLWAYLDGLETA